MVIKTRISILFNGPTQETLCQKLQFICFQMENFRYYASWTLPRERKRERGMLLLSFLPIMKCQICAWVRCSCYNVQIDICRKFFGLTGSHSSLFILVSKLWETVLVLEKWPSRFPFLLCISCRSFWFKFSPFIQFCSRISSLTWVFFQWLPNRCQWSCCYIVAIKHHSFYSWLLWFWTLWWRACYSGLEWSKWPAKLCHPCLFTLTSIWFQFASCADTIKHACFLSFLNL